MNYHVALAFEDGVTRFIDCRPGEKVLDAAYRNQVNLPMDCSDGVCGTCKSRCESGIYELGDDYLEEALTADEAQGGLVLTCQMVPSSDCVIAVPVPSTACKTGVSTFTAELVAIRPHRDAALEVLLRPVSASGAPLFLAGQYVNIQIPGTNETRSYSFSSKPGSPEMSFLIKRVPDGIMSRYLDQATVGDTVTLSGPLGSFYLRSATRPLLFLAGGTGLAPFLSMLSALAERGTSPPIHLIYGVTRDADLVLVELLEALAARLPQFTFATCVAETDSTHLRKGYVTQHLELAHLHDGAADVYLCGPPAMVESVRKHLAAIGVAPANFHYEKFTANRVAINAETAA